MTTRKLSYQETIDLVLQAVEELDGWFLTHSNHLRTHRADDSLMMCPVSCVYRGYSDFANQMITNAEGAGYHLDSVAVDDVIDAADDCIDLETTRDLRVQLLMATKISH